MIIPFEENKFGRKTLIFRGEIWFSKIEFENFSNPNFENQISPRKINVFLPNLFSSKGMIIYFVLRMFSASRFTTGGEPQGYSGKIH